MQGGGRGSRSLCGWQSALICYDGCWLPEAATLDNYTQTHTQVHTDRHRRHAKVQPFVTLPCGRHTDGNRGLRQLCRYRHIRGTLGGKHRPLSAAIGTVLESDTYLLASGPGLGRPCVLASHTLLASSLPMAVMTLRSSSGHSSRSRERTLDRWVPRFRWMPEHSMQIRAPRFRLAQSGSG